MGSPGVLGVRLDRLGRHAGSFGVAVLARHTVGLDRHESRMELVRLHFCPSPKPRPPNPPQIGQVGERLPTKQGVGCSNHPGRTNLLIMFDLYPMGNQPKSTSFSRQFLTQKIEVIAAKGLENHSEHLP